MARGTKSRLAALCACVAALALLAPAIAAAAEDPAAVEQYVNTLPGVDTVDLGDTDPIVARSQRAGPVGVVGENDGTVTALGAVGTAAATPAGIALIVIVAAGVAIGVRRRRESL